MFWWFACWFAWLCLYFLIWLVCYFVLCLRFAINWCFGWLGCCGICVHGFGFVCFGLLLLGWYLFYGSYFSFGVCCLVYLVWLVGYVGSLVVNLLVVGFVSVVFCLVLCLVIWVCCLVYWLIVVYVLGVLLFDYLFCCWFEVGVLLFGLGLADWLFCLWFGLVFCCFWGWLLVDWLLCLGTCCLLVWVLPVWVWVYFYLLFGLTCCLRCFAGFYCVLFGLDWFVDYDCCLMFDWFCLFDCCFSWILVGLFVGCWGVVCFVVLLGLDWWFVC